jgi:eukaryotic-like serine/threonine-protein kinase
VPDYRRVARSACRMRRQNGRVVSAAERRLERVVRQYNNEHIDQDYLDLYLTPDPLQIHDPLERGFASIHERLDIELDFMNLKARNGVGGHFNADNSRRLLDLIDEVVTLKLSLEKVGQSLTVAPEYQRVLDGAKSWLVDSGGSPIPEGFTPVLVEKYDAVFGLTDAAVVLADHSNVPLTVVGEGSYAMVHKFVDPNYNITFARKKLKRTADERDVARFRREYEIMKGLDFPYILQVYRYDESENAYTMEFCESTLEEYVKRRNNQRQFDFSVRRRIALQFLYGLNYLHLKGICHRDLSLKNVLLRVFSDGAVTVKLSDFGLAKPPGSDFTKTETEVRGTFVDPALDRFKDFEPVNDIYVVGFVLSYIFKGVSRLIPDFTRLGEIIQKCSHSDPTRRYQTVLQIVEAVENLETEPIGAPA